MREDLPEDAHVEMAPIGSITGEVLLVALHSEVDHISPLDVRAFAEFDLRNRLLTVPGIAQVVAIGGWLPEYQVEVRQELLQLYDLTSEEVAEALSNAHNLNTAGFLVNVEGLELPLRQSGRVQSIADIEQCIVSYYNGAAVTVKDVATVKIGGAQRRGAGSDNAQEAVVVSIQKAPGTNTLALTEELQVVLDQVDEILQDPKSKHHGMVLNKNVFSQADFINRSVSNVTSTLIEAVIFVSIILLLFLMNVRTTLITLVALPLSLGTTILAMWLMNMSINVMTLGGLAVAIGVLVDDAIIDVENVYRRLSENAQKNAAQQQSFMRVIFDASNEIRSSVVFATVIICIVFVPLLMLDGLEGKFFQPLGITYMISVIASLFVAMTVTPALCWFLLRDKVTQQHSDGFLVHFLKKIYRPSLHWCLRFKHMVLSLAALMVVATMWFSSSFGSSFLPEFNEGTYTVFLMMPPGTSLDESERLAFGVEARLLEIDGVEHVVRRTGRAERDEHAEPPSSSEVEVRVADDADPQKDLSAIDKILSELPGVTTNIGQPISHRLSHVLSGTKAQVAINVFGEDLDVLRNVAQKVKIALDAVEGTRDVVANREVVVSTLPIKFRQHDLARFGLSAAEAGRQVRRAVFGEKIAVINEGVKRYDLVLRLAKEQRSTQQDVSQVVLIGENDAHVRLYEVADIGMEQASNLISRQNAQRKTVISCNVAAGSNLGDLVADIRKVVTPIVNEAACTVQYGGQFEAQQSANKTLSIMGGIIIVVMLMMLYMAFGQMRPAVLVMVNLPLALIGGIIAMFIAESDNPFTNFFALFGIGDRYIAPVVSIASLVGFITLFGIAVRNGILLVNHYKWLHLNTDLSFDEIVKQGSEERLVPVLMTALSAALGLVPLALKSGQPGSELLAPLAIVVLGGLISSTILNMLVVPAGYQAFCRKQNNSQLKEKEILL
ncbi:MAG: efflux RND transporter permease subunit [Planctomycetes bacterium]|nr:efflux RND transporter permease subunit [Planctomycetota bacterium]